MPLTNESSDGNVTFALAFAAARRDARLTQARVAKALNVDRTWVSKVENGKVSYPDRELVRNCEQLFGLSEGRLADRLLDDAHSSRPAGAGEARIWEVFPYDRAREIVRGSRDKVRILQTWVPDLQPFIESLSLALKNGADLEIVILDPSGDAARRRLDALEISDPMYPWLHAYKLFHELYRLSRSHDLTGSWQVRLSAVTPAVELYGSEVTALLGFFWHGGFSMERPHIEVAADSPLGQRVSGEFDALWHASGTVLSAETLDSLRPRNVDGGGARRK